MSIDTDRPRDAVTAFEVVELMPAHALLRIRLETGRTHQIRVHLSAIDLPIAGDPVYGRAGDLGLNRQFLHATRLAFPHPDSGETVDVESPLPPALEAALRPAARIPARLSPWEWRPSARIGRSRNPTRRITGGVAVPVGLVPPVPSPAAGCIDSTRRRIDSMSVVTMRELLEAGVHFGHQTRRWNPKMRRYIFTERGGIYIIDLQQTQSLLEQSHAFVRNIAERGGTVLFVGTKKQAQDAVKDEAARVGMPYVNHRWLGGLLTNWRTISERIERLHELRRLRDENQLDLLPRRSGSRCSQSSRSSRSTSAASPT